jgi:hypothetical protein
MPRAGVYDVRGRKRMFFECLGLMSTQVRPRGRKHVFLMTMGAYLRTGLDPRADCLSVTSTDKGCFSECTPGNESS